MRGGPEIANYMPESEGPKLTKYRHYNRPRPIDKGDWVWVRRRRYVCPNKNILDEDGNRTYCKFTSQPLPGLNNTHKMTDALYSYIVSELTTNWKHGNIVRLHREVGLCKRALNNIKLKEKRAAPNI